MKCHEYKIDKPHKQIKNQLVNTYLLQWVQIRIKIGDPLKYRTRADLMYSFEVYIVPQIHMFIKSFEYDL
jgi:hypothetical protein